MLDIVRYYTREAGVRNLEREIAQDLPQGGEAAAASRREQEAPVDHTVNAEEPRQVPRRAPLPLRRGRGADRVGQVTGLAWTEVGGELLSIEAAVVPGKGKLLFTGQLGDVMKESIQAAMTVVRSRSDVLGLDKDFHSEASTSTCICRKARRRRTVRQRRHRHLHGAGVGADQDPGALGCRDDRRDHAARRSAADRRTQGKAARGASRRHQARC